MEHGNRKSSVSGKDGKREKMKTDARKCQSGERVRNSLFILFLFPFLLFPLAWASAESGRNKYHQVGSKHVGKIRRESWKRDRDE